MKYEKILQMKMVIPAFNNDLAVVLSRVILNN